MATHLSPTSAAFPTPENAKWGLSKRQWMAEKILSAIIIAEGKCPDYTRPGRERLIKQAVDIADALFSELNKMESQ